MALVDNIVSYYKLDGNSNDSVGSNNGSDTGITYNASNGKINNGAGFDGSSSRIALGTFTGLGNTNRSFSLWANATTISAGHRRAITFPADDSATDTPVFVADFTTASGNIGFGGNPYDGYITYSFNTSTWYHVAATITGSTITVYVNGVSVGSATNSGGVSTNPIGYIGRYNGNFGQYFSGAVDEVGIWSRALTAGEIWTLYNRGNGIQYPFNNFFSMNIKST
jgi:hypothetical protein